MEIEIAQVKSIDRPIEVRVTHNGYQWSTIGFGSTDELRALHGEIGKFIRENTGKEWGRRIPK